jgi:hypothetical protein
MQEVFQPETRLDSARVKREYSPMAHHPGRNDTCPCGSGKKYKKCCEIKQQKRRGNTLLLVVVGLLIAGGVAAGITAFTTERHVGASQGVWSPEHGHYHR